MSYTQMSLFENDSPSDPRPPETVTWNGIHGCTKQSVGCLLKNGKVYNIPREYQHEQARKAGLDYDPVNSVSGLMAMHSGLPGE